MVDILQDTGSGHLHLRLRLRRHPPIRHPAFIFSIAFVSLPFLFSQAEAEAEAEAGAEQPDFSVF